MDDIKTRPNLDRRVYQYKDDTERFGIDRIKVDQYKIMLMVDQIVQTCRRFSPLLRWNIEDRCSRLQCVCGLNDIASTGLSLKAFWGDFQITSACFAPFLP